jgi:Holliday junction resolvasome RuvABC ATP-dependent DNA helicase subunit
MNEDEVDAALASIAITWRKNPDLARASCQRFAGLDLGFEYWRLSRDAFAAGNSTAGFELAIAAILNGSEGCLFALGWASTIDPGSVEVSGRELLDGILSSDHPAAAAAALWLIIRASDFLLFEGGNPYDIDLIEFRKSVTSHYEAALADSVVRGSMMGAALSAQWAARSGQIGLAFALSLKVVVAPCVDQTPWFIAGSVLSTLELGESEHEVATLVSRALETDRMPIDDKELQGKANEDLVLPFLTSGKVADAREVLSVWEQLVDGWGDPWLQASRKTAHGNYSFSNTGREPLCDVLRELDALIGLESVKQRVRDLIAVQQVNRERVKLGMPKVEQSMHLVFAGPPGTGKTTVARLIARAYAALGILESGVFLETGRVDLVGGHLGHTAIKTQGLIDAAEGGVLFIDEAYALVYDDRDIYGAEAIATLLTAMEGRRDRFAVIAAGYTQEMRQFIDSNPGLRSRFSTTIEFPPYTDLELLSIFQAMAQAHHIHVRQPVKARILRTLETDRELVADGNGRYVRNLFQVMTKNVAVRAMADGIADPQEFSKFVAADVPLSIK